MQTYECPGCGNIITEGEACCKYCGNANPIYVAPRKPLFTSNPVEDTTTTSQTSVTKPGKRFSIVIFIILLIFFWPAALIYAIATAIKQ